MNGRRLLCLTAATALLLVLCAGCGGSGNGNNGLPIRTVRVLDGTGTVANQSAANQRVLQQYLGVSSRQAAAGNDGPNGAAVVGSGATAPFSDVYLIPGGALPAGTVVGTAEPMSDGDNFILPDASFVFWVDGMPAAELGHECYTLYVRASDGRIVEQRNDFDPRVDGVRSLAFDAARRTNRLYRHELWVTTDDVLDQQAAARSASRDLAAGTQVHTVIIAGTSEARRENDINAAKGFAKDKLGQSDSDITVVRDMEDDRLTPDEVTAAIRNASQGLGKDDKLLIIVSSHGSKLSFTVGDDFMLWVTLARVLRENVTAEHVNLMLGPCHSGAAVDEFQESETLNETSRIQMLTSTDAEHPAWAPGGVNVPLCLYYEQVGAALDTANGDGTLTIDEIETAFGSVDLTAQEANEKYCRIYEANQGVLDSVVDSIAGLFVDTWKEMFLEDGGEDDDVRPHGDPKNMVFDHRRPPPTTTPPPSTSVVEQEPNNSCDTATPAGTARTGSGELTAGDQDHFQVELDSGSYKLSVTPTIGLFLGFNDGQQDKVGSGTVTFTLTSKSDICAGFFGTAGAYNWEVTDEP